MLKIDRQFGLYVIQEQLAIDETTASCKAEDPFFDRDVVIKLVSPLAVGGHENLNRLNPYLESISELEHPAIAPIYDNGIEGETCYFTRAFYTGGSLADQLSQPMNIGKGLRIILQLSSGLAYAYNEGFEHGKLALKDIFFSNDGHAVITDFGISVTIEGLKQSNNKISSLAPEGLRIETLKSLGEILIKLLLGPGAKPDAVSTAIIRQSHSELLFALVTDLLGESEREINNFDELQKRLIELSVLGSEVGIDEYVEYVEQKHIPSASTVCKTLKPFVTPSQRQLEIKEEVYAKGEIRRLVAEKSKLQEVLRRASTYKKTTELKLTAGAEALKAAQKAETDAKNRLKMAAFQTTGQRQTRWNQAVWMVGGLLVGSLLTSGYYHFNQAAPQNKLQAQSSPENTAPLLTPATAPQLTTVGNHPEVAELKLTVQDSPTQEEAELWWPIGGEFDATTAIPVILAPETLLADTRNLQAPSVNVTLPSPAEAESEQIELVKMGSENWLSIGHEFDRVSETGQTDSDSDQVILNVVQNWANAWSNQDQGSYFSYYSSEYRPEPGQTQEEWRSMRRSRLTRPQWIKVILHDLQLRSVGKDLVQVKLKQSYSSNYYQDEIMKSLNLVKENGKWRILMERSLGATYSIGASNDMIGG